MPRKMLQSLLPCRGCLSLLCAPPTPFQQLHAEFFVFINGKCVKFTLVEEHSPNSISFGVSV